VIADFDANTTGEPHCVDVKNGKIVRIRPLHYDEKYPREQMAPNLFQFEARGKKFEAAWKTLPGWQIYPYKKRVYAPNRVMYPLKRVDWEPGGDPAKINPQSRGKSKFKRITWDEATDILAKEIKRVQDKYGVAGVMCVGEDGHHEAKVVHGGCGNHMRLMRDAGGYTREIRNADSWEGWFWGNMHLWGTQMIGVPPAAPVGEEAQNCEMIISVNDAETTVGGPHTMVDTRLRLFYTRELGIKFIQIDPQLNWTAGVFAHKWIPVLPGTDAALLLAVIYTWIKEGTYDKAFVDTHVVGFDKFKAYVMGETDGTPKTPAWASPKCNVPEWTIKALARDWGKKKTTFLTRGTPGNFMRGPYGHEASRLSGYAVSMQGIGKPGTGMGFAGFWPKKTVQVGTTLATRAISGGVQVTPQQIPRTMTHHAILNPPITFWGTTAIQAPVEDQFVKYTYPIPADKGGTEVHLLWSEKPCNTGCWNWGYGFIDAVRSPKVECYVTNHQWLENDCLFADLVLPISSNIEEDDIGGGTFLSPTTMVTYKKHGIEPLGESKSDEEVAREVAKKLEKLGGRYAGLFAKYTEGKTIEQWIKFGYENSGVAEKISWDDLQKKGYYVPAIDWTPSLLPWEKRTDPMKLFYDDPVKNPLKLPSGKLEFYSQRIADTFPDDKERGPFPTWVEGGPGWTHDERISGERAKKYPLLVISNHPRWRNHVQLDNLTWLREISSCKVKGYDGYLYEPVWLHPADAAKRGIAHGDIVKVFNERGTVLGGAYVTERVIAGAALMDHGAKVDLIADGIDRGGSVNLISPEKGCSKNCWGMATTSFLVEVQKVDAAEMDGWRKKYPEAFARAYDPGCGTNRSAYVEGGMA